MWLFTTQGFFSVVAYDERRDGNALPLPDGVSPSELLLVRARVFSDLTAALEALQLPGSRAVSTPQGDYPFRCVLTREEWTRYLSEESERIDYANFKSRVMDLQGRTRHDLYLRMWSILRGIGPKGRADGADGDSGLW
jgi:hypothetical protein